MTERSFLILGSLSGFVAVAAGAFGAHILKKHLDADMMLVFETAVRYQMYHALALIVTALAIRASSDKWGQAAGWSFVMGTVLFSGSLYLMSLTGIKWLGAITPFGGIAFLAGWFSLVVHAVKKRK